MVAPGSARIQAQRNRRGWEPGLLRGLLPAGVGGRETSSGIAGNGRAKRRCAVATDGESRTIVNKIILEKKREGGQKNHEDGKPEDNHDGAEELNVFVIMSFHVHRRCCLPKGILIIS